MTTIADIAKLLGTDSKGAGRRLAALGYLVTCSRCGGSGRFSHNQIDGDRCYGCNGKGETLPRLTKKIAAEAKARQDAGELDAYFAANRARAAAKKEIGPLVAEAEAIYKVIADAYSAGGAASIAACKASEWSTVYYVNESLSRAQTMNNALRWGPERTGMQASQLFADDSVSSVSHRVEQGREDAVRAVAVLRERIADLTALRDAAAPHLAAWIANPRAAE